MAKTGREFAILILAGGRSERLGCLKALYPLAGQPMIKHVFDRVAGLSDEVVISCKLGGRDLKRIFPKARVVVDRSRAKGPLVGMAEALPVIGADYVAVLPCDCPTIKPDVVRTLFERAKGHDGALLIWPNGYLEPLQAVYRTKKLLGAVQKARKSKRNKLGDIADSLGDVIYISTDEMRQIDPKLESFANINSRNDVPGHRKS